MPTSAAKSFEEKLVDVWQCNWKTLHLFAAMGTQWRVGMGGVVGLDYTALPVVAKASRIKLNQSRLDGIRTMESEALRIMSEQKKGNSNG